MQPMRSLLLRVIFIVLTVLIIGSNFYLLADLDEKPVSLKGSLDLSRYDFEKGGRLTLAGEWQFYQGRFLMPVTYKDFQVSEEPDAYITPPRVWNEYSVNGNPMPGFGFGTYRMAVTGVVPGHPLALKVLPQSTAYALYIDDVLMAESGKASESEINSSVEYYPESITFTPQTSEFVITFHISNYVYARGGMWDAPTLGTLEQIETLDFFILSRDLFLLGCYAIMFVMFLAIYLNRPQNRSLLYFAILCVVTSMRILIYGAHLITYFTENFRIITFIEYSTRLWLPVLLLLFINTELSGKIPKRLLSALLLLVSVATAAVALLPIHIFTAYTKALMGYDLSLGLAMSVMILWPGGRFCSMDKSKGFYFHGILSIFICAIYDILFAVTAVTEMTPIGVYVALLAFAFILAISYSEALSDSERAFHELEIESERKLQTELKLLQSQIRPHFLYNALSAIANICGKDAKKAERLILDLAYFMQASFDFGSGDRMTTLENELEYIRKYVHIEKARFGNKVRYSEQIEVPLDTQIPRLIVEPLVENAIRHGISKKKGSGEVRLRIYEVPEGISVEVYDNGAGMNQEMMAEAFEGERRGIGLKNIQERLVRYGGDGLTIESVWNEYTKISFTIKKEI